MRVFDQLAFVRVTVSAEEVRAFRAKWPGSALPARGISFTFDAENGDLVDLQGAGNYDGSDLLALSQDASSYAAERLGRPDLAR